MDRLTDRGYKNRAFMKEPVLDEEQRMVDIIDRLAAYEDTGLTPEDIAKLAEAENLQDSMTESHSEAAILRGCIALMQNLMGRFEEYLEFIDVHPDNEEERFCTEFYMTEIVERLFLWETRHSGGTSQHMKLEALGVEAETVTFSDDRDKEEST